MLAGLEKFTSTQTRQRSSSPKFQVFNTALITAQRHETFTDILHQPALWGRLVESLVGAHLVNHVLTEKITLNYWRDRNTLSSAPDLNDRKNRNPIARIPDDQSG